MGRAVLFTSIVVVCALVALVDVALVPEIYGTARRPPGRKVEHDMRRIRDGIEAYAEREGRYPETLHEVIPYVEGKWLPFDPWREMYVYVRSFGRGPYLFTFGRDHWPGGTGEDADYELHPGALEPHRVADCPRPSERGTFRGDHVTD